MDLADAPGTHWPHLDEEQVMKFKDKIVKNRVRRLASRIEALVDRNQYYEEDIDNDKLMLIVQELREILPILD